MSKIESDSTEANKTKLHDLAIRFCQTVQEKIPEKRVDEKTLRPNLDANGEFFTRLLWLARMFSEEGVIWIRLYRDLSFISQRL